jgi:hypothetical protein
MMQQLIIHDAAINMAGDVGQPGKRNKPTQAAERYNKQHQINTFNLIINKQQL